MFKNEIEKLVAQMGHERYETEKALEKYPNKAGNEYFEGKIAALNEWIDRFTEALGA